MKAGNCIWTKVLAAMAAAFVLASCEEDPPVIPSVTPPDPVVPQDPDPITVNTIPGAYGLEGGDVLFDASVYQISSLYYKTGCSYRILDPASMSVVSFSGFPNIKDLRNGTKVSFLYRVQKHGHTTVCRKYDMVVVQEQDRMVWIKESDTCYIVLAR